MNCENFPRYTDLPKRIVEVLGEITDEDRVISNGELDAQLKEGKGYVINGIVYVYYGIKEKEPGINTKPECKFVLLGNKEDTANIVTSDSLSEEVMQKSKYSNSSKVDLEYIGKTTDPDEVLYDEEIIYNMNAATAKFIPIINEDDDFLKKIIKSIIIAKNVDINRYKSKMGTKYWLTNLKSALIGKTKMSVLNFAIWIELLGVDFDIIIRDNGTDGDTLRNPLVYLSSTNQVGQIRKKAKELNDLEDSVETLVRIKGEFGEEETICKIER